MKTAEIFNGFIKTMFEMFGGFFRFWYDLPVADANFTFGQMWLFFFLPLMFVNMIFGLSIHIANSTGNYAGGKGKEKVKGLKKSYNNRNKKKAGK